MASIIELTIGVDSNLIKAVEEYTQADCTTLQDLISDFLKQLSITQHGDPPLTVLVRLAGILPPESSIDEHREALPKE